MRASHLPVNMAPTYVFLTSKKIEPSRSCLISYANSGAHSIGSQWRAFWHTMTSNDRHASHDSPYRTGQHVPLPQSRHTPLTSVATSALESRTDLNPAYNAADPESLNGFANSNGGPASPAAPYSPGMRGQMQRQQSETNLAGNKLDDVAPGEIQMQNFSQGLPPPPPVSHSWKRIDRWLEDNYEELYENVCMGATMNDVNELEHEMDCTLPMEVRESLMVHDGQERGGLPTGVVFGCMLLDCEEIMQEWQQWRTVNEAYLGADPQADQNNYSIPTAPIKAFGTASSSSAAAVPVAQPQNVGNPHWRQELLDKQDSQPPNAIQKAYAHPSWIPLARDWGGNNIAVDLAPGPTGQWGQVIIMGRDYDCKYVVSRSWAAFLATLADDMNTDKAWVEEESKELKLREFKQPGVEPAYLDILRWRCDQKYGRKGPQRRANGKGLRINSNISGGAPNGYSPYASPGGAEERGRSPQRFNGNGNGNGKAPAHNTSSPRAHLSSPLARVTEEQPQSHAVPGSISTDFAARQMRPGAAPVGEVGAGSTENLMGLSTPALGNEEIREPVFPKSRLSFVEGSGEEKGGDKVEDKDRQGGEVGVKGVGDLEGARKDGKTAERLEKEEDAAVEGAVDGMRDVQL